MMYVLVIDFWCVGIRVPVPFRAEGDDDARIIATALCDKRYTKAPAQEAYVTLFCLDDNRCIFFEPRPKKEVAASVEG